MAARKRVKNEPLDHDEDELRFRFVWIPDKQQDDEGGIWWPCLSYADHDELQSVLTNHTVDVKQAIFLLYREYQKTNPAAVAGRHDSDNINILVAYLCGDHPPVVARFVPNPREVMDFYTNVIRMERRFGDNQMWRNAMDAVEEQMTSHSPRVPARNHGGLIRLIAPKSNPDADCSKSSKRNASKRADDCKGKSYLPKKKQKKSHQRDIKPKVKASNFVGIRTRYKSRLCEEAPFKKYTGMSSIDREEKIILPHFKEMWPILVEHFNFSIHQDGPLYCLPGVTVSDPKMLLGRDYFNSPLDLRKYLCAYGLSNAVNNPSDEEWDALEYWIRYSIVVQLRSKTLVPPVVQLSQPQSWRLLHKIGFRYAGGKYVLPGVQMKPKGDTSWTKPVKGKDFFEHMDGDDGYWKFLARFGIESFPVNNLDEMERLQLELFLTSCPALDSFKYMKPEKGDPLFISNRKDATSRASCHNAQSNINIKDSSENSDTMDKTVEKIEVHCSQTSTKIEYEMACESDKAMNVEDEVDEHKCNEKGDSSDNEHGVQGKDPSQKCNGARNESNTGSSPEKQVQYLVYESDAFEAATLAGDNVVEHHLESDPTKEPVPEIPCMIQTRETVPLDAINVQLSNLETVEPIQPNKETTGDKDDQHVPKAVQENVISQIDSQVQAQEQSNPTRLPYLRNVGNPLDCDNHDKMTEHVKNIDRLESDSGNIIVDSKNEDSREHHVPKGVKKTVLSQIDCHMPVFMANMLGRRSIIEQPDNKVTNLDEKGDNIEVLSKQTQTAMVEVLNAAGLSGKVANDGEKSSIKPMSPVKSGTDDKNLLKDSHKMDGARIMQEPTLQMHHVREAVTENKLQVNEKITNLPHAAKVVLCVAMEISKVGSYHDSIPIGLLIRMCNEASRQELFEDLAMKHFANLIQRLDDDGLLLSCVRGSSIIQQMVEPYDLYNVRVSIGVELEEVECALESTLLQNSFFARMKEYVENSYHS